MKGTKLVKNSATRTAREIVSAWLKGNPKKVLDIVVLLQQDKLFARRVTYCIVNRLRHLKILDRFRVASCLCGFKTVLWIPGDKNLESVVLIQLRRDFPRAKLKRLQRWAMCEPPIPQRTMVLSATWLAGLLDLARAIDTRRARRSLDSMNGFFASSKYPLLGPPVTL